MGAISIRKQRGIIQERLARYARLARTVPPDDDMRRGYLRFKFTTVVPRALRALSRIKSGHYHLCEECHDEIGSDRLRAVPAATKCLSCQNTSEKRSDRTRVS